tara:strand:+ start:981 stop:1166 length:186 start_codon:yes stop_codon:yes gene_type:complete
VATNKEELIMPMGKGTYGSKVGRPAEKKKKMMGGKMPKKKMMDGGKMGMKYSMGGTVTKPN